MEIEKMNAGIKKCIAKNTYAMPYGQGQNVQK